MLMIMMSASNVRGTDVRFWEMVFGELSPSALPQQNFAIFGSWIFAFLLDLFFNGRILRIFAWMNYLAHRLLAFLLVVLQSKSVCDIRSLDV